jgi:hypothetical protein
MRARIAEKLHNGDQVFIKDNDGERICTILTDPKSVTICNRRYIRLEIIDPLNGYQVVTHLDIY